MLIGITGGSGFVGRALVKAHLECGDQIRLLSRKPASENSGLFSNKVEYFQADLVDPGADLRAFCQDLDILYHCAGEITNEALMHDLHVNGTKHLLEAARGQIGRWVQLSSVGAYGLRHEGRVSEETEEEPFGIYEQTKTKADTLVKTDAIPHVIVRPSNIFASSMTNRSLFQLVEMVERGYFFYLGPPGALVNYIHVDDVVEALICCGSDDRALGETYNLSQTTEIELMIKAFLAGLGRERRLMRLPEKPVRLLAKVGERLPRFPLTISRIDALTSRVCYDASKIETELGFAFGMSLEERFRLFAQKT
jgi:nucleoside-diphosphate-sugar epimerase